MLAQLKKLRAESKIHLRSPCKATGIVKLLGGSRGLGELDGEQGVLRAMRLA